MLSKKKTLLFKKDVVLNLTALLSLWAILASCSVKSDKDSEESVTLINQTVNEEELDDVIIDRNGNTVGIDTDGDGLSDSLEDKIGRSKTTGIFPMFSIRDHEETTLTLKGVGPDRKEKKVTYKAKDNLNYSLEYTPIRDKIARNSYNRTIGNYSEYSDINIYDSSIVKISKYSEAKNREIDDLIEEYENDDSNLTFTLRSIFSINLDKVAGISKIYDLEANLGFIDENGQFSSFGSSFNLLSTNNTRIVFNSDGVADSSLSNMKVMIYVDRININDLRNVFDDNNDLALRIINYKAITAQDNIFEYSDQLSKSSEKCVLYAISTPESNHLLFNAKKEPISKAITDKFGDIETDGEGTLLSLGGYVSNTDYPIIFEEGGNDHLMQKSWQLFSENGKVTDNPSYGETVSLGFFNNYELAQAGRRENISESVNVNVVDSVDIACRDDERCADTLLNGNSIDSSNDLTIKDLNIGEYVEISVSGESFTAKVKESSRVLFAKFRYEHERCQDDRGPSAGTGVDCYRVSDSINKKCTYKWKDVNYTSQNIFNYSRKELEKSIGIIPATRSTQVSYDDKKFFNLYSPNKINESKEWFYTFKVTDDFLENFGSAVSVRVNKIGSSSVRIGYQDLDENSWCKKNEYALGERACIDEIIRYQSSYRRLNCFGWHGSGEINGPDWHKFQYIDATDVRNIKVNINRYFKK